MNYNVTLSADLPKFGNVRGLASGGQSFSPQSTVVTGSFLEGTQITTSAYPVNVYYYDQPNDRLYVASQSIFIHWESSSVEVGTASYYSFVLNEDRVLTASFSQSYALYLSPIAGGGTLSVNGVPNNKGGNYLSGSIVNLMAYTSSGYKFVKWTDETSTTLSTTPLYSVTMSAELIRYAYFSILSYTASIAADPSGSGMVLSGSGAFPGSAIYPYSSSVAVAAVANGGFRFIAWESGSARISTSSAYTLILTGDRVLTASFLAVRYMLPYYFTGNAGTNINIWLQSTDYAPEIQFARSGSAILLATSSQNGWAYDSVYTASSLNYTLPTTDVYKIEATTLTTGSTGNFTLRLTQRASASLNTNNTNFPSKLVYSPDARRVFANDAVPAVVSQNLTVFNPATMSIAASYTYANTVMFDGIFNSVKNTYWLWYSGSSGEFLDEYNGSGSALLTSHPITTKWGPSGAMQGFMAYNSSNNQILLVPLVYPPMELSYSIYDCNLNAVVEESLPPTAYPVQYPAYVGSTGHYYVGTNDGTPGIKIDGTSPFAASVVSNFTGSVSGISYVPEVDRIFFEDPSGTSVAVFNPNTDSTVAKIPGITDFRSAIYDICRECIIIADDAYGAANGGLCLVVTSSYAPLNFISLPFVNSIVRSAPTSTILASNYANTNVISLLSSAPTGSPFIQPPIPPHSPTGSIALTVTSGSAILDWAVIDNNQEGFNIQRSTNGTSYSTYVILADPLSRSYTDEVVAAGYEYWYRLNAYNLMGTSSWSNISSIFFPAPEPPGPSGFCVPAPFQAILYSGSGDVKNNPRMVKFDSTGTGSLAVWCRTMGTTRDTKLIINDPMGTQVLSDDDDGWNNPVAPYNSAGRIALTQVGEYGITMSAWGTQTEPYQLVVSPGFDKGPMTLEYAPSYVAYVSRSGYIAIGGDAAFGGGTVNGIAFYNITASAWETVYNNTVYSKGSGVHYSKAQDKVFGILYSVADAAWRMVEFDNTGGLVATYSDIAASFGGGFSCYDSSNDRIFMVYDNGGTTPYTIWDCATRAVVTSANLNLSNPYWCVYADSTDKYYVSEWGTPMTTVDATSFVVGATTTNAWYHIAYVPETGLIVTMEGGYVGLDFIDPVLDSVVYQDTSLQNQTPYEFMGATYDPCTSQTAVLVDVGQWAVCMYDANFSGSNCVQISDSNTDGDAYGICFAETGSKVYVTMAHSEIGGTQTDMWSCKLTVPVELAPQYKICNWLTVSSSLSNTNGPASVAPEWDGVFNQTTESFFAYPMWFFTGSSIGSKAVAADEGPNYPGGNWTIDTFAQIFFEAGQGPSGAWILELADSTGTNVWWIGTGPETTPAQSTPSGSYTRIGGDSASPSTIIVRELSETC